MASPRTVEEVPVVEARIMGVPLPGVRTRPMVVTPRGKGKCIATAPSTRPSFTAASSVSGTSSAAHSMYSRSS